MNATKELTTAQLIRKEFKAKGWKASHFSVRTEHSGGMIWVQIKTGSVEIEEVEAIARKYEVYQRDYATGEILCGGNTFVQVQYTDEARAEIGKEYIEDVRTAYEKIREDKTGLIVNVNSFAQLSIHGNDLCLWIDKQSDTNYWNAESCLEKISFDIAKSQK